jgi:uncharacterized protein (TIGR02147 family)
MSKQIDVSLFTMDDFRPYLEAWARAKGRGAYRRLADELGMHTTLVSQVLNSKKCLTEEQASKLCVYMSLTTLETDYFLKLVQIERAGSVDLKTNFKRHLVQLRRQAQEVKNRVPTSKELTHADHAIFYSSWHFAIVRLLTGIDRFQRTEEIAQRLNLSVSRVQEILDFLVSRGLCHLHAGKFSRTEKNTHVDATSSLVVRHHQNWREVSRALQENMTPADLAFTAPVSIAKKDLQKVRAILLDTVSEIAKVIETSPAEEIAYLGIDWIKM